MADFSVIKDQFNSVSDVSATWNDMLYSSAGYEYRFCASGAGAGNIASASWPIYARPLAVAVVPECWGYVGTDNSGGIKLATYDGTTAHYMQNRISWDATGTFAAAPVISAWKDNTYPAAVPGTQPGTGDGSAIINGQTTDTSNRGYYKANAYGYGVDTGGTQQTPSSNAGGTLTASSGTTGAVSPGTGAWLSNWQDLASSSDYIQDAVTPKATTAGFWYYCTSLWTGPNMCAGTLVPVKGVQYSWV